MKRLIPHLIPTMISAFFVTACARFHGEPTNGTLDVRYDVPADLIGRPIFTYFNGECLASGTGTNATFTLRPRRFVIRVEMDGARSFEREVDIHGNGSHQFLGVTLLKR